VIDSPSSLLSGRRIARNVVWNLAGLATPLLVAVFAIPLLIEGMGLERFGLLAIIWMGIGYFSLFDMGLGRALTKLVADHLGAGKTSDLGPPIWTALFVVLALGVIGAVLIRIFAYPLVVHVLNVDSTLHSEAIDAFKLLAIGIPVVVVTSTLLGLLEAHQRFATITAVRIPLGVLTFAGPLATVQFIPSLAWATAVLLATRVIALLIYFIAAASVRSELTRPLRPDRTLVSPLLRFGGWITVSNVVSPLMVNFDRLFIGAIMTLTSVTYYVTPFEVLSRLQVLPQAMLGVLFPAMTTAIAADRARLVRLVTQGRRTLFLVMLPATSGCFLLAPEALEVWLGQQFRVAATPVVHWLAAGVLVNALARIPFAVLQSAGRPDLTAKTHLIEVGPYVVVLAALTYLFGIAGTAAAWFVRVCVDAIILNVLVQREVPELRQNVQETLRLIVKVVIGFGLLWLVTDLLLRGAVLLAISAGALIYLWHIVGPLWQSPLYQKPK
jgi:O-antigen/teichoic acid export membrane protein